MGHLHSVGNVSIHILQVTLAISTSASNKAVWCSFSAEILQGVHALHAYAHWINDKVKEKIKLWYHESDNLPVHF